MPKGIPKKPPKRNTRFTGKEPRCKNGHSNCPGLVCIGTGGPGTDWLPEYNQAIEAWFEMEKCFKVHYDDHGRPHLLAEPPRTFEGFASSIKVHTDTLNEWAKPENQEKYPGFSASYARAKQKQREYLIVLGSVGAGNPGFIMFMLKNNHNMRDVQDQRLSNPDGGPVTFRWLKDSDV